MEHKVYPGMKKWGSENMFKNQLRASEKIVIVPG